MSIFQPLGFGDGFRAKNGNWLSAWLPVLHIHVQRRAPDNVHCCTRGYSPSLIQEKDLALVQMASPAPDSDEGPAFNTDQVPLVQPTWVALHLT